MILKNYAQYLAKINGHIQTLVPHYRRKVQTLAYKRTRINTPDGDFLDLDWAIAKPSKTLIIISHGLEGNSQRYYVKGMVKIMNDHGYNALAWNMRSCGGELNRTKGLYHAGSSHDLALVIDHSIKEGFQKIVLVGFSMGGNITLKYLGECSQSMPSAIKCAIAISTPTNLKAASQHFSSGVMKYYEGIFLNQLIKKMQEKSKYFPEFHRSNLKVKSLHDFMNLYIDLYGFSTIEEYYERCSSNNFISRISLPTLILNAQNDPFLPSECYPIKQAKANDKVILEMPINGGHAGFIEGSASYSTAEKRSVDFIAKYIGSCYSVRLLAKSA